jgi:hypothetical protein
MAANTPRKKKNVKQLLAEAQRAVRTVKVCTRADLAEEYETLETRLAKAKADNNSIGGNPQVAELSAQLEELREQLRDATIEVKIRGLPRRDYTKLVAAHAPREGNKADAMLGMNVDEVVEQLIKRGTFSPDLDAEDWEFLLGDVTEATYEQLTNAAWSANNRDVSVPF